MKNYPAGYTVLAANDTSRSRPILIDAWYPALPSETEKPFDYRPGLGQVAENVRDSTFFLDYLRGQSRFQPIADQSQIGALGHSSGGATVIELAGARLARSRGGGRRE
jgi:predicted dienelactone hydrolase